MLDTMFKPLAGLNIERIYTQYHTGIDLILYLVILIAACRLSLARMFPGPHGRTLGTAVGIVLAIALSVAERSLGFSMKSFGPIAAGIVILSVSLIIYNLLRHAGAGHIAGGATALIVTYFTMRAVLPGFFLWAQKNEWSAYLHMLLVLAVLVAIWRFIQALFTPHETSALRHAVSRVAGGAGEFIDVSRRRDAAEWRATRKGLQRLTIRGRRECDKVIRVLEQAIHAIEHAGKNEKAVESICAALTDLKAREHVLTTELERIQAIDRQLLRFDLTQYRELQEKYKRLSAKQQAQLKQLFVEEREKVGVEQAIENLAARAETYAIEFDRSIDSACACLRAGRNEDATDYLNKAIEQERQARKIIEDIRSQTRMLLSLLGRQIAELDAASRQ